MPKKHRDKQDRRQRHIRRLGTQDPACVGCSETDPRCLEAHHIAGRKQLFDTAIVCCNCHRKLSDDQRDHPPTYQDESHGPLEVIGRYLLGLCDLLIMVASRLREFGELLIKQARCPEAAT